MSALVLLLLSVLTTASASKIPLALAPSTIAKGGAVKILVTGAKTAGGLTVHLVDGKVTVASVDAGVGADSLVVSLSVPATATTTGSYTLELTKTITGVKLSSRPVTLVESSADDVGSNIALIVETDKPVYKPG
jgi:hypothetical protein